MLRMMAILFGIGFIFGGVAGFLPSFTQNNLLFGYFEVGTIHNVVHLVTGVIAIMCATKASYAKVFFMLFGILYAIVAIVGFARNGDLYLMTVNMNDNILHIVLAVIALYLGFSAKTSN